MTHWPFRACSVWSWIWERIAESKHFYQRQFCGEIQGCGEYWDSSQRGAPALREDFLCLLQCVVTLVHMHMKVPAEPKVNAVFVQSTMKAMVKCFLVFVYPFHKVIQQSSAAIWGKKPSMNGRFAGCRLRKQTKSSLWRRRKRLKRLIAKRWRLCSDRWTRQEMARLTSTSSNGSWRHRTHVGTVPRIGCNGMQRPSFDKFGSECATRCS